jgi:hypothetical protein
MKQFAPVPAHVEKFIADGLVLDDNDQWVPMAEMIEKERGFRKQLEEGNVLVNEEWVPIAQALKLDKEEGISSDTAEESPVKGPVGGTVPDVSNIPLPRIKPPVSPKPQPTDRVEITTELSVPAPEKPIPVIGADALDDMWDIVPWYRKKSTIILSIVILAIAAALLAFMLLR